ncbi:MAG: hypothetical protein ACTTJH_08385 [Bacteroidales bacterium]
MKKLLINSKIISYSFVLLLLVVALLFCICKYYQEIHTQQNSTTLPYNLSLEYWGYDVGNLGVVITDKNGFVVIGKGDRQYIGKEDKIYINKIKNIAFDNEYLKVEVLDTDNISHNICFDGKYFMVDNCNDFMPTSIINIVDDSYDFLDKKTLFNIKLCICLLITMVIILSIKLIYNIIRTK